MTKPRIVRRRRLRGAAADAAFRVMPPRTQRTLRLVAELCKMPLRRAVRALIEDYGGDAEELRVDAVYDLVKRARVRPKKHWPKLIGASNAELAERVVGDGLISKARDFPDYLADVHFVITGEERVL